MRTVCKLTREPVQSKSPLPSQMTTSQGCSVSPAPATTPQVQAGAGGGVSLVIRETN